MSTLVTMRLLFVSHLYPSSTEPYKAAYNRQLVQALAKRVEVRVIAPVLTFPGQRLPGRRGLPPMREVLDGIQVMHPPVFYTPGLFVRDHWRFYQRSVKRTLTEVIASFVPDHVVIGFVCPDVVAVAPLCRELQIPCSTLVLGSDFRVRVREPRFRNMIVRTLNESRLVFCPGRALKEDMVREGIEAEKIVSFNNGVDHEVFCVPPRADLRQGARGRSSAIGGPLAEVRGRGEGGSEHRTSNGEAVVGRSTILFVGNLVPVKRPEALLKAFQMLTSGSRSLSPDSCRRSAYGGTPSPCLLTPGLAALRLVLVGSGRLRRKLERLARRLGIAEFVEFLGQLPHAEVARRMSVADCLCLPSASEGMPNVVIEALACGTPVVATRVGEVPFLIEDGVSGCVVDAEDEGLPARLAHALAWMLSSTWDRDAIPARVTDYTWESAADTVSVAIRTGIR